MTNKTRYIPLLLLLLALFSCTSREEREFSALIEHADSIADRNPDSALAILSPLLSSPKGESLAVPTAKLLRVKIDDKLYRPITGYESLVTDTLLPYFRHHDSEWLPTALFYAGRICADKGDAPQAIDYYQQTLDALPEQGGERFRGLTYIQMGWLFLYQELYEEAISHLKLAYQYELEAKDSVYMTHILQAIGTCYLKTDFQDSAYVYYNKALTLAVQGGNDYVKNEALEQMAHISIWKKDFQKARAYLDEALSNKDSSTIHVAYTVAVMFHYEQNHSDSVLLYAHKLLKVGNIYNRYTAYKALASIYLKKGQPELALEYQNKWEECDDSIRKQKNTETLARMHSLYNYSQYKLTAQELTISNRNLLVIIVSVCFLLVVTILLLIIHSQRSRIREEQLQLRIHQLLSEINRKEPEQEATEEVNIKDTPIYQTINRKLSGEDDSIMKDSEWNELATMLNDNCQGFTRKLKELHPMNESELRVSMLLKVGCSPKQIARLCCITISGVSNIRSRLVEKIMHLSAAPKAWDQFIQKL